MRRAHYSDLIADFTAQNEHTILGELVSKFIFPVEQTQRRAWQEQIRILKKVFKPYCGRGKIYFEYDIPRLGRRIDAIALIDHVIFVIEFKVGATEYDAHAIDQVCDYALDLKNFHESSHAPVVAPILVATEAEESEYPVGKTPQEDNFLAPINASAKTLADVIQRVLAFADGETLSVEAWESGGYHPTPTIIEAAVSLYGGHSVQDISRNDAGAVNLRDTSEVVVEVIRLAKAHSHKAICFVTGVPGAGKTLVGLDVATRHNESELSSVFLSGNAPLVMVLREALAHDKIRRNQTEGKPRITKTDARRAVKSFIQNVHNFRDDCLIDQYNPPHEHIAIFDEAQRAWDQKQTKAFMHRKKGIADFDMSEPEFLVSCLDRHNDWAVVVCLVGGGQEIRIGEIGISGWIDALVKKFPHWHAYISSRLSDSEYAAGQPLSALRRRGQTMIKNELHLATSMRSFRAERISTLVKQLLDLDIDSVRQTLGDIKKYPIVLTRDVHKVKEWLRKSTRGSERYGMVVSSQAERLRPYAVDLRARINPVHWFLHGKKDVRSSYYLEDVATEYEIQGLEVDWACVTWDADFRYTPHGWEHWSFKGSRWNRIRKPKNQLYQKNAYRVLLTRARQGMVIVVPEGDKNDPTRNCSYYDSTFHYLKNIGFEVV